MASGTAGRSLLYVGLVSSIAVSCCDRNIPSETSPRRELRQIMERVAREEDHRFRVSGAYAYEPSVLGIADSHEQGVVVEVAASVDSWVASGYLLELGVDQRCAVFGGRQESATLPGGFVVEIPDTVVCTWDAEPARRMPDLEGARATRVAMARLVAAQDTFMVERGRYAQSLEELGVALPAGVEVREPLEVYAYEYLRHEGWRVVLGHARMRADQRCGVGVGLAEGDRMRLGSVYLRFDRRVVCTWDPAYCVGC